MSKLYHRKVYWENSFNTQIVNLLSKPHKYSTHVLERLYEANKSHNVSVNELEYAINIIKSKYVRAFECEINNDVVIKFVTRVKLDNKDISVVFLDIGNELLIKSYWINSENDKHITLDKSKYQTN